MSTRFSILFVCLGNICRSPLAEAAFRKAAAEAGLEADADSAGTADYHVGTAPDPRSIAVAAKYGMDISGYRGRQLQTRDFTRFTHIFAMDHDNLAQIEARAPAEISARLGLLLDVVPDAAGKIVKDPYYSDDAAFEQTWADVERAAKSLVEQLSES